MLAVLFIGYVVVEQYAPKPLDWTPTFSHLDKNPFGGKILYDRLADFFTGGKEASFQTLYELRDSTGHVIVLASTFKPSEADIKAIYHMLAAGRDVFIASGSFDDEFLDSVGLSTEMKFNVHEVISEDTIAIAFNGSSVYYPSSIVRNSFIVPENSSWEIHAMSNSPVLVSRKIHEGRLVLSSTPLAFTNYGILYSDNYRFTENALQIISDGSIIYNRFYQSGKVEPQTPFRYLLSQTPLRWALYLALLALGILLVIGSRRKQRVIPLLDPKENTTVKYIKTIGGLYHREGNHKSAAEKIIAYFLKSLSEKYYLSSLFTETSYRVVASKTGLATEKVVETFDLIREIRNRERIPEEMLKNLHQKITLFNLK